VKQRSAVIAAFVALSASSFAQPRPTARQIIERIQKNVGVPWTTPTVDTFKAGNPDEPISGIAVTMMATLDVLEHAAASGRNLVITHEPTFYNHLDSTDQLEKQSDAVLAAKQKFIQDHHLVVWRFHDHWHARKPDGILLGMTNALGWEKFQNSADQRLFTVPETTLDKLAESVKRKLNVRTLRVVGDAKMKLTKVGFLPVLPVLANRFKCSNAMTWRLCLLARHRNGRPLNMSRMPPPSTGVRRSSSSDTSHPNRPAWKSAPAG